MLALHKSAYFFSLKLIRNRNYDNHCSAVVKYYKESCMIEKLEEIALEACSTSGVALYDLEVKNTQKGKVILVFITKIGGISLDDCSRVSRIVSDELDLTDLFESDNKYFLEVSSPGLERNLRFKRHYASAINENVKITYVDDEDKKTIKGKLAEVLPENIVVNIENSNDSVNIKFNNIKKAKTFFDFKNKE